MPHGLLVDNDQAIADWVCNTFNVYKQPVNRAYGIVDSEGKLKGAILFQNFNGVNLELSYYGPRTLSSGIVRIIARTALGHFIAARLTVVTSQRNKRLLRALLKIGFRLEGTQRCFYGHADNKRNTGVRLVAFHDALSKVAYRTTSGHKIGTK